MVPVRNLIKTMSVKGRSDLPGIIGPATSEAVSVRLCRWQELPRHHRGNTAHGMAGLSPPGRAGHWLSRRSECLTVIRHFKAETGPPGRLEDRQHEPAV